MSCALRNPHALELEGLDDEGGPPGSLVLMVFAPGGRLRPPSALVRTAFEFRRTSRGDDPFPFGDGTFEPGQRFADPLPAPVLFARSGERGPAALHRGP